MRCYIIKLLSNPCSTHMLELLLSPLHVRAHKPGLLVSYACLSPTRSTPDDMGHDGTARCTRHHAVPTSVVPPLRCSFARRPARPRRSHCSMIPSSIHAWAVPHCRSNRPPSLRTPRRRCAVVAARSSPAEIFLATNRLWPPNNWAGCYTVMPRIIRSSSPSTPATDRILLPPLADEQSIVDLLA